METTLQAFGGLDVLINNAGVIEPISHLASSDPDEWGQVIDINLKGVYNGIRAALPVMKDAGGGSILTISSGAAHDAIEAWSHYCASKAAVNMLGRSVHLEEAAQWHPCHRSVTWHRRDPDAARDQGQRDQPGQ